jgi:preprotein translocase subunit SecA
LALSANALNAEKDHHLQTISDLLEQSQERLKVQLEERLDLLDTFVDGLEPEDETSRKDPRELAAELNNLVRLPLKLNNQQIRQLGTEPEEMAGILREQVRSRMMELAVVRLVGAIERLLKEPLDLNFENLEGQSWDALSTRVIEGLQVVFMNRFDRLIGNGSPGQIAADLDLALSKLDQVSTRDLVDLVYSLPQGRRAAFDKKTHRRVWVRTNRMTYIYSAAHLLENSDPEEIAGDVLAHLEEARKAIRYEWGQNEFKRLVDIRPADLEEESRLGLERALGEAAFAEIRTEPFSKLEPSYREAAIHELGRQGMTRIYRQLLLSVISNLWVEYLTEVEALRVSIGLEAYAQRDPLVQYKNRAFEMFQNLLRDMRLSVVSRMFTFQARDRSALRAAVEREEVPAEAVETTSSKAAETTPAKVEAEAKSKKKRRRRR